VIAFPHPLKRLNNHISNSVNVIFYLTMVFAASALLIAFLAYRVAILRPRLKLTIQTWLYEKEGLALSINPKSKIVTDSAPLSSWRFWLDNYGHVSAKYPMVQVIFKYAYFSEDAFPGWKAVHHAHALGWHGFQWSPGSEVIVYQGVPVQLPAMHFSGKQVSDPNESENNLEVEITTVADGIEKQTYKLPVRLEYSNM
jgi:hypothetical protein